MSKFDFADCYKTIIAEGPDLAGKTTFMKKLSEITGYKVHHSGGPITTVEQMQERITFLKTIIPKQKYFDRHVAISEFIYGNTLRDLKYKPKMFIDMLSEFKPLILFFRPSNYVLLERLKNKVLDEPKAHKPKDHIERVTANYWDLVNAYDNYMILIKISRIPIYTISINSLEDYANELKIMSEVKICAGS